jgi:hypothetical protein
MKIKDAILKRHESKKKEKKKREKTIGTLMPAKKRENNGAKTPARENKR